ncbi:MAG: ABC transporter ATP-binding protein, partial [Oscillospiraceae bacterium]|nr:ABC transporter ATP-binding protein [Oscillospiraceae bacterium]
ATRIWELSEGTIHDYPMGFAEYRAVKAEERRQQTPAPAVKKAGDTRPVRGNRSQQAAKKQLTICESAIAKLEEQCAALDAEMERYGSDAGKLAELYARKQETEAKLESEMSRWEELSMQLEE